jgi:hypothetical protein
VHAVRAVGAVSAASAHQLAQGTAPTAPLHPLRTCTTAPLHHCTTAHLHQLVEGGVLLDRGAARQILVAVPAGPVSGSQGLRLSGCGRTAARVQRACAVSAHTRMAWSPCCHDTHDTHMAWSPCWRYVPVMYSNVWTTGQGKDWGQG